MASPRSARREETTARRNEITKPGTAGDGEGDRESLASVETADIERERPISSVLSIRVPKALMRRLDQRARKLGKSPGTLARELIEDGLMDDGERTRDDLARLFSRWVEEARSM